jgi:hypothetical protein
MLNPNQQIAVSQLLVLGVIGAGFVKPVVV